MGSGVGLNVRSALSWASTCASAWARVRALRWTGATPTCNKINSTDTSMRSAGNGMWHGVRQRRDDVCCAWQSVQLFADHASNQSLLSLPALRSTPSTRQPDFVPSEISRSTMDMRGRHGRCHNTGKSQNQFRRCNQPGFLASKSGPRNRTTMDCRTPSRACGRKAAGKASYMASGTVSGTA